MYSLSSVIKNKRCVLTDVIERIVKTIIGIAHIKIFRLVFIKIEFCTLSE